MATSSSNSNTITTRPRTWFHVVTAMVFVIMAGIALSEMRIRSPAPGFQDAFNKAVETLNCEGQPVRASYTGIEGIDMTLRFLVVAFLPGAAGFDKGSQVLQAYFLVAVFPLISIWCIEAGRRGSQWSLISFPAFYSLFYQTVGGAIIIPIYYLAYMWTSARKDYFSPNSRAVPPSYAKALIPALVHGYLIPTIMVYLPYEDPFTTQFWVAFWQPSPLYVSVLTMVFSFVLSGSKSSDVKFLNIIYAICFTISTVLHIGTMYYCLTSTDPAISLASVFDLRVTPAGSPLTMGVKYIFQLDFWVIFTASVTWAYLAIYDLKQLGKTQVGMVQAFLLLALASVVLGPAAAVTATWYWREQLLAKKKVS